MKKIEMRELTAEDIGMMFDIASAVGSDEIAALTEDPAIAAAVSRLGSGSFREVGAVAAAKAVAIIIRNYRKCEPLLRQLLASVTGKFRGRDRKVWCRHIRRHAAAACDIAGDEGFFARNCCRLRQRRQHHRILRIDLAAVC